MGSPDKRVEQVGTDGTDPRHLLKFLDFRVALPETKHLILCLGTALEGLVEGSVKPPELISNLRLGKLVQIRFPTFLRVNLVPIQIKDSLAVEGNLDLVLQSGLTLATVHFIGGAPARQLETWQ
jgi:hypothetical protein